MEYDVKHEHVICDETKNKEIFLNLISNAVKYTASGGRVTIRITELDCDRKDYVRIRTQVIDTGIGMSEEFLPSLFELLPGNEIQQTERLREQVWECRS